MTDDWTEWGAEEFLSYVSIHCETPRALFSADMVERLYELAGHECIWSGPRPEFIAIRKEQATSLIQDAYKRLRVESFKEMGIGDNVINVLEDIKSEVEEA